MEFCSAEIAVNNAETSRCLERMIADRRLNIRIDPLIV